MLCAVKYEPAENVLAAPTGILRETPTAGLTSKVPLSAQILV